MIGNHSRVCASAIEIFYSLPLVGPNRRFVVSNTDNEEIETNLAGFAVLVPQQYGSRSSDFVSNTAAAFGHDAQFTRARFRS